MKKVIYYYINYENEKGFFFNYYKNYENKKGEIENEYLLISLGFLTSLS